MKENYIIAAFRETVARRFPEQGIELNRLLDERLSRLRSMHLNASKGKQFHLESQILPGIAAYETLQTVMPKDEALQTVAAAMQSCLRQTDILIRYGGDEFLLLMPQNCPDGVESVIRRVQNAVRAARVPSHPELRLSVSIGGVCNVQPLTEAIRQADARMYCNKENGEQVL